MKIISRIEINYFRSIYTANISDINDLNIIVGGNDSGKSNILKALNLFFNNKTEIDSQYLFEDDLSRLRESEARAAKGRAFLWIKITFKNFLNWSSLPEYFTIKRTWNRYENRPQDALPQGVTGSTVGRFLNRLSYHYIPAIRSKYIYSYYLNALHDSLIDDEKAGVRESSEVLMSVINASTNDMAERIKAGLSIESNIQVPKDLRELFTALDFSTKYSGYDIPLQKRGDGIQCRHIPFILDFIARHSKKFHIWGYEEPENSLELGKAFELANQFNSDFSKDNQIFITTHSPAFYDLNGKHVSRWLVSAVPHDPKDEDNSPKVTSVLSINENKIADDQLGLAALISDRARELHDALSKIKSINDGLYAAIKRSTTPQVLVEGPSDLQIFKAALSKIYPNSNFCELIHAEGCTNIAALLKSHYNIEHVQRYPIIGIFDNDNAGRKQFEMFKASSWVHNKIFKILSKNINIYGTVLPFPKVIIDTLKTHCKRQFDLLPLPIEFLFPHAIVNYAIDNKILILNERSGTARDNEFSLPINMTEYVASNLPTEYKYFAYSIDDSCKKHYAEWVSKKSRDDFIYFADLLNDLKLLCTTP